ncbi:MAG: ATP-grasp domain-containing protein [Burkholderiales bacterium]
MKRILITGIGGDIAQGVATLVREARPGTRLIGSDIHDEHAGRLYVNECLVLPPARESGYAAALRQALVRHEVDVLIPVTEPEIGVMAAALGDPPMVHWISPGPRVVAAGLDKLSTAQALAALGLSVPWTVSADNALPQAYPCVLKPRFGSGSRGIFIVNNEGEARSLTRMYPGGVFQELLEPAAGEVTCAVYRTREGRVATLQLLRRLAGGLTGWAKVIHDAAVEQMCATIANGLHLAGSMNVQLRMMAAGPRVFEINPRFSSTAVMRHLLGFTDVAWTLDELDGSTVSPTPVSPGRIAVRVQGAAILD